MKCLYNFCIFVFRNPWLPWTSFRFQMSMLFHMLTWPFRKPSPLLLPLATSRKLQIFPSIPPWLGTYLRLLTNAGILSPSMRDLAIIYPLTFAPTTSIISKQPLVSRPKGTKFHTRSFAKIIGDSEPLCFGPVRPHSRNHSGPPSSRPSHCSPPATGRSRLRNGLKHDSPQPIGSRESGRHHL